MKDRQKLKLGDSHVTPRNIHEVQASKLGDAQDIPFFINKSIRSSFKAIYFYCFICYVLLIRPICITILYHNLLLFIDIFHIGTQYLCYFIYFACFIIIGGSSTGARILLEKAPSERNISEDQLWKEIIRKILFFKISKEARRRS